jgi:hypothetical protein
MPEIALRHEFDCDEDTYWNRVTFDSDFNRRLYLDVLKFLRYELVEDKEDETARRRRVQIEPPLGGLPAPVQKAIGDKLSYVEVGTFDKKTRRYAFSVVPSVMADRSKTVGELFVEPLGGGKGIVRVAKIKVEVKAFMVGGLIEEKILGDLRGAYEEAAKFTRIYLKEKGL